MRTARTATVTAVVAASTLALGMLAPVAGAEERADKIGDAARVMLRHDDVSGELGLVDRHTNTAVEAELMRPVLCQSKRPQFLRKGKRYYQSEMELVGPQNARHLTHRAYVYERISFARHAFTMLAQRVRRCVGTWRVLDWEAPVPPAYRVVVASGRTLVRSEGKRGVWVSGNFARGAALSPWAEDWYAVYLRSGHSVQVFTYTVDAGMFGVPGPQRRVLNRLSSRLALRWLVELGRHWH